jgi:hypothetical protein
MSLAAAPSHADVDPDRARHLRFGLPLQVTKVPVMLPIAAAAAADCLQDMTRTGTYHAAITENRPDFEGKTVMDVGAGSGILSLFAAQVGPSSRKKACSSWLLVAVCIRVCTWVVLDVSASSCFLSQCSAGAPHCHDDAAEPAACRGNTCGTELHAL